MVEFLQLLEDRLIQLTQRQELPVAQRRQDKGGDDAHGALHHGLVLRRTHPAGNDGGVVMLRQLLVGLVQRHLAAAMSLHAGLQVVALQYPGHAAEVAERIDVRRSPTLLVHGEEALHIDISAVRQHRHEYVHVQNLAGDVVDDFGGIPGSVHLHDLPGLVVQMHGGAVLGDVFAIVLIELCGLV